MLIKKIMDTIEANSSKFLYTNEFIIYKNTIKNYPDVRFFNYIILNNISFSEEEKNKMVELYIKSKKIINNLNFFSRKIKFSLYKKYDCNFDLLFNSLDNYKEVEVIKLIQNKTIYKFRILDLINLWKISLLKSETMFATPKNLKNPYTNIEFKNHNLYNIFFSINKTKYIMPQIILNYYKCSFDITDFKKKNFPFLQEKAIEYYGNNGHYIELFDYLNTILHVFREDTEYIFLKQEISSFKKNFIVKNMKKIIILYLKYKYLCNPLLKEKYLFDLKRDISFYFKYRYSSYYFIKLTPTERIYYNNRDVNRNDTSNDTNDISNNDTENNSNEELVDDDIISLLNNTPIVSIPHYPPPSVPPYPPPSIPPPRNNSTFVYRRPAHRRPVHRRTQAITLPPLNTTINEIISNSINDIPTSTNSTSTNSTSTNSAPNNINPFIPSRELQRSPNVSNVIRDRFQLF